jgi:hypothetical protein
VGPRRPRLPRDRAPDNVIAQLDAGVRIGAATPEAAEIGRRHTKIALSC